MPWYVNQTVPKKFTRRAIMFSLTEQEIQRGFEAIEHHGYSALLPTPPEWKILRANWDAIRTQIAGLDLDIYVPIRPIRVYAPKSRATVRVVNLLHPVDLVIYTSLTLIVVKEIEQNRIPIKKKKVFSFRFEENKENQLYGSSISFKMFRGRLKDRNIRPSVRYVAIADIADFYPRIYQHRLENIIESCCAASRGAEIARVLVKKLIGNFSGSNSYGIPVGPYASRVLAEAVLIDVDSFLVSEGLDFVRWVDDYYFFTKSENEAQEILISLAQRLYEKHGLTLSALKTKIVTKETFQKQFDEDADRDVDNKLEIISEISSRFDSYLEEEIDLSDEEVAELAALNIEEIVEAALEDHDLVDYTTLSALLRHPKLLSVLPVEARQKLAEVLLRNIAHLYPIAEQVANFFRSFVDFGDRERRKIKNRLLLSLLPRHGKWPPNYYVMWMLSLFAENDIWGGDPIFVRILRDHKSEIVRRSAALAIAMNGTRADALEAKDRFDGAAPLEQLALLMATRKLGKDERKHWRMSLQITGSLEKQI